MRILLTGATGYIAQRLLPVLLGNGNEVICCVRDKARFNSEKYRSDSLSVIEVDFYTTNQSQAGALSFTKITNRDPDMRNVAFQ